MSNISMIRETGTAGFIKQEKLLYHELIFLKRQTCKARQNAEKFYGCATKFKQRCTVRFGIIVFISA